MQAFSVIDHTSERITCRSNNYRRATVGICIRVETDVLVNPYWRAIMASKNPGNFANNRQKASEAGKKGGQASGGNFANDRARAAEAGRKGGQHSHAGGRQS